MVIILETFFFRKWQSGFCPFVIGGLEKRERTFIIEINKIGFAEI